MSKVNFWTTLDELNPNLWPHNRPYPILFLPTQYDYVHSPPKKIPTENNKSPRTIPIPNTEPPQRSNSPLIFFDHKSIKLYDKQSSNKTTTHNLIINKLDGNNKRIVCLDEKKRSKSNTISSDDKNTIEASPFWTGFSVDEKRDFLVSRKFHLEKSSHSNSAHYLYTNNFKKLNSEEIKKEMIKFCEYYDKKHGTRLMDKNCKLPKLDKVKKEKHRESDKAEKKEKEKTPKLEKSDHRLNDVDASYIDSKVNNHRKEKLNDDMKKFEWQTSWQSFLTIQSFSKWRNMNDVERSEFLKWGDFHLETSRKIRGEKILMSSCGTPLTQEGVHEAFELYKKKTEKKERRRSHEAIKHSTENGIKYVIHNTRSSRKRSREHSRDNKIAKKRKHDDKTKKDDDKRNRSRNRDGRQSHGKKYETSSKNKDEKKSTHSSVREKEKDRHKKKHGSQEYDRHDRYDDRSKRKRRSSR